MSGLLDKANKAAEDKEEAEVVDAVVEVSAEGEVISEPSFDNGLNMDAQIVLQIGGVVGFISKHDSCFLHTGGCLETLSLTTYLFQVLSFGGWSSTVRFQSPAI